jgi:hypothetical protein
MLVVNKCLASSLAVGILALWSSLVLAADSVRSAISTPAADFPKELNQQCLTGRVEFILLAAPDGSVFRYREIHSTNSVLSQAVEATVRSQWRFEPREEPSVHRSHMQFAPDCDVSDGDGFDPASALTAVTGSSALTYWTAGGQRREGHSVLIPESSAQVALVDMRRKMSDGYVSFVGPSERGDSSELQEKVVQLVIAKGSSQFDILRLVGTAAPNHGLTTSDIVSRLGMV